jgi:DNA-binding LacI/PurR family transcriptional regulator
LVDSHAERYKGFLESFRTIGEEPLVFDIEVGKVGAVSTILPEIVELCRTGQVDSIAAVNDLTLYEILFGLRASGIDTPSVAFPAAGYDAAPYYRFLTGPLASVDINPLQVYCEASRLLMRKLAGETVSSLICPPKLQILGDSSIVFV